MKKQKRIALKHGSARVDENCSQETIDSLNRLCELAYEMDVKEISANGLKIEVNAPKSKGE
jgi:hypothetical protein